MSVLVCTKQTEDSGVRPRAVSVLVCTERTEDSGVHQSWKGLGHQVGDSLWVGGGHGPATRNLEAQRAIGGQDHRDVLPLGVVAIWELSSREP